MIARAQLGQAARVFAIILAAVFVYWPALNGSWLWDDNILVVSNVHMRTLAGLGQIWFPASSTDYWPLTSTFLWLEWHLWEKAPLGYHLVNVALHIAGALLIWRVLSQLGCRCGWIGALLFAVHPLAVESVAWVSEVKNALSLPLFLLAFSAWIESEKGRRHAYLLSLAFFLLALFAKTSTVMLPLVLALYCWWARGRVTRAELLRFAPYFALALLFGLVTSQVQNTGHGMPPIEPSGIPARLILAGTAACFYLGKFLLPVDLLTLYPAWPFDPPTLPQLLALPALAVLIVLLAVAGKTWTRHALFGLGFYLVTALPVLGLVNMRWLQYSPVADHLIYLPIVGLVGLTAALAGEIARRVTERTRPVWRGALVVLIATLAVTSHLVAGRYTNSFALWTYTLERNPLAWAGYTCLGAAFLGTGHPQEALTPLENAVALKPDFSEAQYDLGNALIALRRFPEAITQYNITLKLNPDDPEAWYNLGNAFLKSGQPADAIAPYEQALRLIPDSAEIRGNYAQALMRTGRSDAALAQYEQAAQLQPASPITAYNLGLALGQTGHSAEAVAQFQRALELDPRFTPARQILSRLQSGAPDPTHP